MYPIQTVFSASYEKYLAQFTSSTVQSSAAWSIIHCKSGRLGCNLSRCSHCDHLEIHNNSCRNRNCPCCQGILKELWIDARKSEVIDSPYFHVVFTMPAELRPLIYANQSLLYSLMHQSASKTLLECSSDKKYLGATPSIIQILHTWGQEMNYHPHIHCIISGAGLTQASQLLRSSYSKFFIPIKVLGKLFRGKFLEQLQKLYASNQLKLPPSCSQLINTYNWADFRDSLYKKAWIPYIKETFNGFGNAIDYLGRYTHRIAISNARIASVSDNHVSFWVNDYKTSSKKILTLTHTEFIRRFLMHVLPSGFQKIRYYGFLNNRSKKKNLALIEKLMAKAFFKSKLSELTTEAIFLELYGINIRECKQCGQTSMRHAGRTFHQRN